MNLNIHHIYLYNIMDTPGLNHNLREKILQRHYRDQYNNVINQLNNEIECEFNFNKTVHTIRHRTQDMITMFIYEYDGDPDFLVSTWMINDITQIELSNRIEYYDERCVQIGLNLVSFDVDSPHMEFLGDMDYEEIDKLLRKYRFR
jgi:hypothetical protein